MLFRWILKKLDKTEEFGLNITDRTTYQDYTMLVYAVD